MSSPQPTRSVPLWATVAAVVAAAVVVGVVVFLLVRDGGDRVVLTPTPTATATVTATATPMETPTAPATVTPTATATAAATPEPTATLEPPDTGPPSQLVAISDDGRLVVVDTASGDEVRELDRLADPNEDPPEEGPFPNVLTDVSLAPAADTVWYGDCCEPAAGNLYRIPIEGGEREHAGNYYDPAVSPDGQTVAAFDLFGVVLIDVASGETGSIEDPDGAGQSRHLAWSPDGTRLAWERFDTGDNSSVVVVADAAAGASPTVLDSDGASWTRPAWRRDGFLVVAEQPSGSPPGAQTPGPSQSATGHVVDPDDATVLGTFDYGAGVADQDYDPTGRWLLVALSDGTLRYLGAGEEVTVASGFRAASW